MTSTIGCVLSAVSHDIQISGRTNFPEWRWREAILFYLFGIWSNNNDVTYRPKVHFGDICLRLDRSSGEYYAYGHAEGVREDVPPLEEYDVVEMSGKQAEVEVALIRFVKDDRVRQLQLHFPAIYDPKMHTTTLVLWKKTRRGEYGIAGLGLPYSWSTSGPIWTLEEYQTGDWWKRTGFRKDT